MKRFVLLCLVSVAVAAPALQKVNYSPDNVHITRYENENPGLGNYRFAFEQTDGTRQEQQGELRNEGTDEEYITIKGSYSWVGPDGIAYTVNYTADENGFVPIIKKSFVTDVNIN